jgi:small-conductance mechanosensitive channel
VTAAVPAQVPVVELGTASERVLATVGLLVGLAVAWLTIEAVTNELRGRLSDIVLETLETITFTVLVGGTAYLLVVVWDAASAIGKQLATITDDDLLGVRIVVSVLVLSTAYGVTRIVRRVITRSRVAELSTDHRRQVIYHVVQVTLYAVGGLLVLAVWEVDLQNLLIGAGVLGVVLGLAARETLGAVIAGFVLLFGRPFTVGDWVIIADREGTVQNITIVNTRLQTLDGEEVILPNDRVASEEVVNRSRKGRLRETVDVSVDYETDVREAIEVAERAMFETDGILKTPTPRVVAERFGDSAVVLELQFWIADPSAERLWRARTNVVEAVKNAYDDAGIDIPFPQRTLSPRDDAAVTGGIRGRRPAPDGGPGGEDDDPADGRR